jgi:hypothetical protein
LLVEPGGEVLDRGEVEEGDHEGFELFGGKLVDLNGDSRADIAEFLIEQYGNERSLPCFAACFLAPLVRREVYRSPPIV